MRTTKLDRRLSQIFLSLVPFLIFSSALVRSLRQPVVHSVVVGLFLVAIVVAVWRLGAWPIRDDGRKGFALAGVMLIAPWAVLSALVGLGPPWQATAAENRLRFAALLVAGILITGAFVVLREALRDAGERRYSILGFAAIILAGPLSVIFALFPLALEDVALQQRGVAHPPEWFSSLQNLSELALVVEVILIYLAIAAFAVALRRTGWLGGISSRVFVAISFFAILCLVVTIAVSLQHPDDPTAVFKSKVAIPGFVVSIPAIPLIMPCLIGAKVLGRAGDE